MAAGTYAALKVLDPSAARIYEYIKHNNLPQGFEDRQALHCTVIWSKRECPNMVHEYDVVHRARPAGLHVFHSEGKKRLVLMLDAPTVVERHKTLMREHKAEYMWDEFHPHVTIAYDIGEFDWWKLPPINFDIILGDENVRAGNDLKLKEKRPKWKRIQKTLSEIA